MMGDWQPIENAPKDGRYVLLIAVYGSSRYVVVGRWRKTYSRFRQIDGDLYRREDSWEGFWEAYPNEQFSHWMPLPELPPEGGELSPAPQYVVPK